MHGLHGEQAGRCLGVSTVKLCDSCGKRKSSHPWASSYLSAKWRRGSADVCLTTTSQDSQAEGPGEHSVGCSCPWSWQQVQWSQFGCLSSCLSVLDRTL